MLKALCGMCWAAALVIVTSSVATAQDMRPNLRRFYVYNECYQSIVYRAQYTPVGQSKAQTDYVNVDPGRRVLVAVEEAAELGLGSIIGSARSRDDKLGWASRGIPSLFPELTYVIACNCDPT